MERKDQIIIINGSPRKNKNCSKIIKDIIEKFEGNNIEYQVLNIYDMEIDYCNACGFCDKKGYCRIKDDMTPIYKDFDNAKGTIVVSPIYFRSISTKLKTLVDRTQAIYSSKYIFKQPCIDTKKERSGMFIAIGGEPPHEIQFLGAQLVMDIFFKCINTKLNYNLYMSNSDDVSYDQNEEFKDNLINTLGNYIKEIKSI